ncbi:hypothetical protein ACMFMF_001764 [Clarireedia jacksonii]
MVHLIKFSLLLSILSTYEASGLVSAALSPTPTNGTPVSSTSQIGTGSSLTSTSLTCAKFNVPTADDPEEDGTYVDGNSLKRRSVAGRIKLEARARPGPTSFGTCKVPAGFGKLTIPGIPTVDQVFGKENSAQPTDLPLLAGVARYYDRDVSCDGTTKLKKRSASELTAADISGYSMDHVWELKFLLEFFKTITPPVSNAVFTDCNNFNEVFFPNTCNNIMQQIYDQVPTNTDKANRKQIEFAAMLKDLNNKKGVIFKPNEFTNTFWRGKNLPAGDINAWIVVLQDVGLAMEVCKDPDVVPLFDKTNRRMYDVFKGIDSIINTKKIDLKNKSFSFASAYQSWINSFLTQQAGQTWSFVNQLMTDTQTTIDALPAGDINKAQYQTWLDNFKNGDFGKQSHYSFTFDTTLSTGSTGGITFARSLFARQDSCVRPSSASWSKFANFINIRFANFGSPDFRCLFGRCFQLVNIGFCFAHFGTTELTNVPIFNIAGFSHVERHFNLLAHFGSF